MNDLITTGFSRAMFSTWFFVRPFRLLLDCGEGVAAKMRENVFAIETIALSHGHMDHIAGLPGFLFARSHAKGDNEKPLKIIYPEGSDGVESIGEYISSVLDIPFVEWIPAKDGDVFQIRKDRHLHAFQTKHIPENGGYSSSTLGYQVVETRRSLKPEYVGMEQAKIAELANAGEVVSAERQAGVLTYSGDTIPLEKYGPFEETGLFMHECTFLKSEEIKENVHSLGNDVVATAKRLGVKNLFLYHFSIRYKDEEIQQFITQNDKVSYCVDDQIYWKN